MRRQEPTGAVDNDFDSAYTPLNSVGAAPSADIKTEVVKIRAPCIAPILWKPAASFTSEWERMRCLRFADA